MRSDHALILDLVTDPTELITQQLISAAQSRLQPESSVTVLASTPSEPPFPGARTLVSADPVELLFQAKTRLDEAGITEIVLVTSLLLKKFWEDLCLHEFSAVHTWSVVGIDVTDQTLVIDVTKDLDCKEKFRDYLKTVGNIQEVRILRSSVIPESMFNAGFHDRHGGVSQLPPIASLNMLYTLRKPDPVLVIQENRRRLAHAAGFELDSLQLARVEHGNKIWVVGREPRPPKYDGLVTNTPGVTVAAPGADCCMILLADPVKGACGAVHSGWMGTALGAVRALLKTMVQEFGTEPSDVRATIGPSIEKSCFSLPVENVAPFRDLNPDLLAPCPDGKSFYVDLVRANILMLELDGVGSENIDAKWALCTVCNPQFFSHQRDSAPFGNQIGFISFRGFA